ncbi:valine--tRNA ligase [Candidatus Symbiobacter mobilis]|nr:valine--tRNA ligase [Candidatus Symbiobacter mobilis]
MPDSLHQPALQSLSKSFDPASIEARWGPEWETRGYASAGWRGTGSPSEQAAMAGDNFAIQLPPPNVTGTLHMGHAFNQTIMDSLTRYHRMRGYNTAWIPGTDHAGIATQIVVERQLQARGLDRRTLGETVTESRERFVTEVWAWKNKSGKTITTQMRRLGASVDWGREYFTMDTERSRAVTETFVRLAEQGLIYRGKRLVNWDPVLHSAVSDLEVESEEEDGSLWHILYPFVEGEQEVDGSLQRGLIVATTRPETLLGDVAVMVHPADPRYGHLIGKHVALPLCQRTIPIIADEYVDAEFGTGVVKVTPAHDANDYAVGQRHRLPMVCVLGLDATLRDAPLYFDPDTGAGGTGDARPTLMPTAYQGLDRFVARDRIVADLQALGLLVRVQPHKLMVPRCVRTGQIIEPMLTDQWFVATRKVATGDPTQRSIAQKAIDAVESGAVRFVPENWNSTFFQWMHNIQDWCISRQLWWGHQIPAWYGDDGAVYVARNADEAASQARAAGYDGPLRQDEDVLDTWFSSAMVPFSTVGWPWKDANDAAGTVALSDHALYFPSSVLVTGYDILFFWVARMIMMTTHFTGQVPFRHVYLHGLVRDAQGKKMSKSEGNVLDPVDLIDGIALPDLLAKRTEGLRRPETAEQIRRNTAQEFPQGIAAYGADALRLTFASLATLGRTLNFDTKRCEGYRNFCNKLWNASRFVLMHCEGYDCGLDTPAVGTSVADRWIVSRLHATIVEVHAGFAAYRLDNVATAIYSFVWNEYCDWYLEIAKVQLQTDSEAQQRATRRTLLRTLEAILRLAHPLIPFVTEELWQKVADVAGSRTCTDRPAMPVTASSLSVAPYPESDAGNQDDAATTAMQRLQNWVDACRNLRSQMALSPAARPALLLHPAPGVDAVFLDMATPLLCGLARLEGVRILHDEAAWNTSTQSAPVLVAADAHLCLAVAVDAASEQARLRKELARLEAEIAKARAKLSNPAFVAKAPLVVVEQERQRCTEHEAACAKVLQQLQRWE